MKNLLLFGTLVIAHTASSLFAEPTRTLSVIAHFDNSKSGDEVWKVPKFLEGDVWLPVDFGGKSRVLEVTLGEDDAHIVKTIHVVIQDPASIIPGGAASSGSMASIFGAYFPYTTEVFPFYRQDGVTWSLRIEEDKPAAADTP
jgi:hypothetical protein